MIRLKDILSEELNEAGYPEDLSFEEFAQKRLEGASKISNDAKLKLDYDKQKFQQIFDAEMKKLAEEGK
jgi:hypothetical protein